MNTNPNLLSVETFMQVIRNTPLISIDLLIYNGNKEVLLGWRNNLPARNYWFVPGGRIYKDESIRNAFSRITQDEAGVRLNTAQAVFHGVFEHFYPNENFAHETGFGTHYVVLAFEITLTDELTSLPREQHTLYKWMSVTELLEHDQVHPYVKNYFNGKDTY
jgi:colanic acid biosynthesis protein WcaH